MCSSVFLDFHHVGIQKRNMLWDGSSGWWFRIHQVWVTQHLIQLSLARVKLSCWLFRDFLWMEMALNMTHDLRAGWSRNIFFQRECNVRSGYETQRSVVGCTGTCHIFLAIAHLAWWCLQCQCKGTSAGPALAAGLLCGGQCQHPRERHLFHGKIPVLCSIMPWALATCSLLFLLLYFYLIE